MKKIALAVVTALIVLAVVPQAWAGDHKVRHRWKGPPSPSGPHPARPYPRFPAPPTPRRSSPPRRSTCRPPVYVREHRHYHHYRDVGWVCEFDAHRHGYHHDHHRHHQPHHSGYGGH